MSSKCEYKIDVLETWGKLERVEARSRAEAKPGQIMNYSGAASHQLSHSFRDLFTPDPSLLVMLLGVSPFHIQPHFIPMKVVPCVYSIKASGWIARWGLHLILGFGVTDSSLAQFYKALIHALPLSTKCVWQYINNHIVPSKFSPSDMFWSIL